MGKPKESQLEEHSRNIIDNRELVLHNDDYNSFEFVVSSLEEICGHEPEQAYQCTIIAHFKGKCVVKTDKAAVLTPMALSLQRRKISVTIQ